MSAWESSGKSDEWYTPPEIFAALGCRFDCDVAAPVDRTFCHVPADKFVTADSLSLEWKGFIWCNPPFGGRNSISKWLDKMFIHYNGIALAPDRTSVDWWQYAAHEATAVLHIRAKIKFIRPDGSRGKQPNTGTTLFAYGQLGVNALLRAQNNGLGIMMNQVI